MFISAFISALKNSISIVNILAIFFLLGVGVLFLLLIGNEEIFCNRLQDMCYIKRTNILTQNEGIVQKIRLSDIRFATVSSSIEKVHTHKKHKKGYSVSINDTEGEKIYYRTMLQTKNALVPLFSTKTNIKATHDAEADKFNRYLNSSENEFKLEASKKIVYGFFSVFYFVIFMLFFSKSGNKKGNKGNKKLSKEFSPEFLYNSYRRKTANSTNSRKQQPVLQRQSLKAVNQPTDKKTVFNSLNGNNASSEKSQNSDNNGGVERL